MARFKVKIRGPDRVRQACVCVQREETHIYPSSIASRDENIQDNVFESLREVPNHDEL